MSSLQSKNENYYYQYVMVANREANAPFSIVEEGDCLKVKETKDRNGKPLVKGLAYKVLQVQGSILTVQPLAYADQTEYMHKHTLDTLEDRDFAGVRVVMHDNTFLVKKANVEKHMWFLQKQKKAFGTVNEDGCFGEKQRFVTNGVQV
ncbi:hypothetical protein [Bacillus thuringiensis]|uniref:hypothetical protein n=1 Tax=Bacillus thuringiensis TaxID=1428 RepID=UPI000BFE4A90|nr:hypothetical protein [Bacillus thuringiensis]PGT90033.1 hypothetical protein COD17_09800 [Bacillus thuringiensis]